MYAFHCPLGVATNLNIPLPVPTLVSKKNIDSIQSRPSMGDDSVGTNLPVSASLRLVNPFPDPLRAGDT